MQQMINSAAEDAGRVLRNFSQEQTQNLQQLAQQLVSVFTAGGRLLVAGTGSSLAISQLIASHFSHKLSFDRPPLPAIALGSDPVLASSLAGSSQKQYLLSHHYRALSDHQSLLLICSHGNEEPQLRELIQLAADQGQFTALLTPTIEGNSELASRADLVLQIDSSATSRQLEAFLFLGHLLCELVEAELFGV